MTFEWGLKYGIDDSNATIIASASLTVCEPLLFGAYSVPNIRTATGAVRLIMNILSINLFLSASMALRELGIELPTPGTNTTQNGKSQSIIPLKLIDWDKFLDMVGGFSPFCLNSLSVHDFKAFKSSQRNLSTINQPYTAPQMGGRVSGGPSGVLNSSHNILSIAAISWYGWSVPRITRHVANGGEHVRENQPAGRTPCRSRFQHSQDVTSPVQSQGF